ncbi:MAG: TonB-dependent receptor, partial [Bacteroidetes bacterium]|nr:TonB-dependent receptor [Bacteroidota bacterium]
KASFSQTVQYQQELRNSVSPFNSFYIWLASNPNIPAQKADHLSLGYYVNLNKNMFRGSVELYYKWLHNQIDFIDHAILFQNPYLEREIRAGDGRAYGIECMLEKVSGKFNGWINYTYARSLRTIEGINDGKTYPAYYDLPHEAGITLIYEVSPRWTLAANWQYTTGKAANLPAGSFQLGNAIIPLYEGRNSSRLPDYHRLDISASIKNRQNKSQRWKSNWVIGIQNVYNRKNALSIDILPYRDPSSGNVPDDTEVAAYKTYIFGLIPSISYNFEF